MLLFIYVLFYVLESVTNVVKGERKGKRKTKFFSKALPNRSLYYENVVKGERKGKRKTAKANGKRSFSESLCRTAVVIIRSWRKSLRRCLILRRKGLTLPM